MHGLAARVKREVGLPVAASWNLGLPQHADRAARELGHADPFSLVPTDSAHWLNNFWGHAPSIGLPQPATDELSERGLQRAS